MFSGLWRDRNHSNHVYVIISGGVAGLTLQHNHAQMIRAFNPHKQAMGYHGWLQLDYITLGCTCQPTGFDKTGKRGK